MFLQFEGERIKCIAISGVAVAILRQMVSMSCNRYIGILILNVNNLIGLGVLVVHCAYFSYLIVCKCVRYDGCNCAYTSYLC